MRYKYSMISIHKAKLGHDKYREELSSWEVKVTIKKVQITFQELYYRENLDLKLKVHNALLCGGQSRNSYNIH